MAISLLAAIDRHVTPEGIERLFPGAKRPPIAGRADHSRAGEILHYLRNGLVHLVWRHDEIADPASLGAVALKATAHHDCLPRHARAYEPRQPQVGGARNNAFLARRKRHVGIAAGDDIVHRQQVLAAAPDGEYV